MHFLLTSHTIILNNVELNSASSVKGSSRVLALVTINGKRFKDSTVPIVSLYKVVQI